MKTFPRNVEKEYNRMLRSEKYLKERDAEYLNQSADFDDILEINPDPASIPISEFEAENIQKHNRRLDYLPVAMQMLKADYPEGYFLIKDYYYNQDKVSMMYLASKYSMTFETVRYRIDRAKELLKDYIILHENI
ncbi:hypothetical protein [Ruminococcus sp.]